MVDAIVTPSPEVGSGSSMRSGERTLWLTAAQALVLYLQKQFTERDGQRQRLVAGIFGIFGHGNVAGLGQAIAEAGTGLPYYQARNEQSMVHCAIGFAKANRRTSTLACTSSIGPGATNMVTGAATAHLDRLPVLLLPGDYYASRRQGNVLQQLEHPVSADASVNDCLRPVSRYFDRIERPEQLIAALPNAMRVLSDPADTGPVTLALCQDVQSEAYAFPGQLFDERVWSIERRPPAKQALRAAADLLQAAERPLGIAVGGVLYADAEADLEAFAEAFGVPVAETMAGKGAIKRGSALLVGAAGVTGTSAAGALMRDADLVVCIGTRLSDFVTGSRSAFQHPDVRFVTINVSGYDAHKLRGVAILADAREALRELTQECRQRGLHPRPEYLEAIAGAKRQWQTALDAHRATPSDDGRLSHQQVIDVLSQESRSGDAVVAAAGGPVEDLHKLWDASGDRWAHLEFGYSCMGHEIPAGLGVKMARPTAEVFILVGDGGYLMNPTELVTAAQEGLKVTVVVSQNQGFQVIRRLQMLRVGHGFGNEFRSREPDLGQLEGPYLALDLAKTAEGFGARAWHVAELEEFRDALRQARREAGPCVIVVETARAHFLPGSGVWWDVAPAQVSSEPETIALRAAYEAERNVQRNYS
jgi:3D-(3,5/4)-trihydroxycyclohexane-1,2-dione acylhydrolase (decyclizing)